MAAIGDIYKKIQQGAKTQEAGEGEVNFQHVADDIGNWFKHLNYNPLSTWQNVSFATPPTPPAYKVVNPVNAAGEHPTGYTPTNEDKIKQLLGTGQSVTGLSDKELESGLTDPSTRPFKSKLLVATPWRCRSSMNTSLNTS